MVGSAFYFFEKVFFWDTLSNSARGKYIVASFILPTCSRMVVAGRRGMQCHGPAIGQGKQVGLYEEEL